MSSKHNLSVRNHDDCWEQFDEGECEWWEEYASPEDFLDSFPVRTGLGTYWFKNYQYDHKSADCPEFDPMLPAGGCVDMLDARQSKTHRDELDWDNFTWVFGYSVEDDSGRMLVYTGSYRVD